MILKYVTHWRKKASTKIRTLWVDTGLIASAFITRYVSIAVFASDVGLSVGISLKGTSPLLSVATTGTRKPFKILTVNQEKHDAFKPLGQSKLDSIADVISQTMQEIIFD